MLDIAEENIRFAKDNPFLLSAAKQKAVSVYFHLLFQIPNNSDYSQQRQAIQKKIIALRSEVLKDPKCIKKTRIALILSYLGFNFTRRIFAIAKGADSTL